MTNSLFWLKVSRPRFWLYIAGTFLVGVAIAADSYEAFLRVDLIALFLFFLLPANFFLYGVNDYFDFETDELNPKKQEKEVIVAENSKKRSILRKLLLLTAIASCVIAFFIQNTDAQLIFMSFLLLSIFYSAPPLRFKARPFLDFVSNLLYILPGVFAFVYITGFYPALIDVFMLSLWAWGMHLFSAVPDIEPDKKAGVQTTAVVIGKKRSLMLCSLLWLSFCGLLWSRHDSLLPWSFIVAVYPATPLLLLLKKEINIARVYWYFPFINSGIGFGAFIFFLIEML